MCGTMNAVSDWASNVAGDFSKGFNSGGNPLDPQAPVNGLVNTMGLTDARGDYNHDTGPLGQLYSSFIFSGGGNGGGSGAGTGAEVKAGFDPGGEGMYSAPTQTESGGGGGSMFSAEGADNLDRSLIGPDAGAAPGSGSMFAPDFVPNASAMPSNDAGLSLSAVPSSNFPTTFNESSGFPGDPGNITAGGNSANYGPTSSETGSWYDDFLRRAKANPVTTGMSGLNVGMGLYGLYQAQQTKALAQRASQQQDPFGPQRAQYQAQLQALMSDPGSITKTPGYDAGLQAVTRKMASQGYVGSGNMMAALQQYGGQFYDQSVQRLMALSGANISPSSGAVALQGNRDALTMQGQSLNNVVYGLSKMFQ